MKTLRLVWRLLFFVFFTAAIVAEIGLGDLIHGKDIHRAMRVRQRWARKLLRGVGIRLTTEGSIPDFPCLIVGNHRSYLDPILMLCDVKAYPVAKAEVANWPILGKGAQMAGILYLKRENASSRAGTLRLIGDTMETGFPVIIFPEGTTSGLPETLPFKKGGFQLAGKSGFPIVPVAVCYADERDFWIGTETFLSHAGRRFREKEIHVRLCYGPVIRNEDPNLLLQQAKTWIDQKLVLPN